jgi:hypothetical protein
MKPTCGCWKKLEGEYQFFRSYHAFGIGMLKEFWNGTWIFCPICGKEAEHE